jgi:small subunit ribosomal protein S17
MARNIGLDVSAPKKQADSNDEKNPFNGTLPTRGKLFEGVVVKASAKNTIVIEKESPIYFTKFKRYARGKSRIHAHVPSNFEIKEGDKVLAAECRPISKSVSFVVVEVKNQ